MKIKAAVVEEQGAPFTIKDDVELAEMQADDIQVHMVASGICHSDEALRKGDAVISYPIVLGHEGAGIVEKVGPEVKDFKLGDHVILSFYGCGNCVNCMKGMPTKCLHYAANNLSGCVRTGVPTSPKTGMTWRICLTNPPSPRPRWSGNAMPLRYQRNWTYVSSDH